MTAVNNHENTKPHCSACAAAASHDLSDGAAAQCFDTANRTTTHVGGAKKHRGLIGRWLDRLTKANEREFGGSGPSCCH